MNPIAWAMLSHLWRFPLARQVPRCSSCGKEGHVAASCPDKLWSPVL